MSDDDRKVIIEQVNDLLYEERMEVLRMLMNSKLKISRSGDGSRVMLDQVPKILIKKIAAFIRYKLILDPIDIF
jgi:hypothetical protein